MSGYRAEYNSLLWHGSSYPAIRQANPCGLCIGAGLLLAAVVCWSDEHRPARADSLDDLTSQMNKAEVSEALTVSWLYNLATINLLVTVADRADMRDHLVSLMETMLELFGEERMDLSEEGETMLSALHEVLETAVEREQRE